MSGDLLAGDHAQSREAASRTGAGVLFYTGYYGHGERSTSHVVRVRPDGSGRQALTSGPVGDASLVAAPDGEKVAFGRICLLRSSACAPGLYVVNRAGTRLRRLAGTASPLAWSPDGQRLAYRSTADAKGVPATYVMNADGTHRRRLTKGWIGPPAWSPDGRLIAFISQGKLVVMRENGRDRRSLAAASSGPIWSPDGGRLLFDRNDVAYLVSVRGGRPKKIGPGHLLGGGSWSPDGRSLALYVDWEYRIDILGGDGSNRRPLTSGGMPTWSPDGKWVAYLRGGGEQPGAIWIIRPDGSGRHRVTTTGREAQFTWTR